MWPFIKRDPFARAAALVFLILSLSYVYVDYRFPGGPGVEYEFEVNGERYVNAYWLWFDNAWYMVALSLTIAALVVGRQRQGKEGRSAERQFWDAIAVGLAFWLLYCVLYAVDDDLSVTVRGLIQSDVLFLLSYLMVILAIDLRPDRRGDSIRFSLNDWIEVAGTVVFGLALLTYFVAIPYYTGEVAELWTYVNSYYLYLTLDVYLIGRLFHLASTVESFRWRRLYGLLGLAYVFLFVTNLLELLSYDPDVNLYLPTLSGPLWFVPVFTLLLAGRLRLMPAGDAPPVAIYSPVRPARLVVCTLSLPLLHLGLYGTGLVATEAREARDDVVLVFLLIMGLLAQVQYIALRRRSSVAEKAQREAVSALERSARDYRGLFENAHDAILIFQPEDETVLEVNARACEMYGLTRDEFLGTSLRSLTKDPERGRRRIDETLERGRLLNMETTHVRSDGSEIFVDVNAAVVEYRGRSAILSINRDVTARKQGERRLLHDALHDALTGLANRTLFADRLRISIERHRRTSGYQYAVLFLDLDRFKVINDSLGHLKGDLLLVEVARRLRRCLRTSDTAARLGGDEFTVLLDDIHDASYGSRVAERIHEALALPFDLDGEEVFTSVSIGIALGSSGYESPEDVLRDADLAMYRAKENGSSCYAVFDPLMHERAVARLQLETNLRRALEREELVVHYQPIVTLADERIVAFEALVRWRHPELGIVLPADFLPVAEETGLIESIGEWVIGEACRELVAWRQSYVGAETLSVSVNLSPRDLQRRDLGAAVAAQLRSSGLEVGCLHLEVTEGALMGSVEDATQTLEGLRDLGVRLHIDDFGTGYSSLGHLQRFPIDSLKVDRSFTGGMTHDPSKLEIVRTVIAMAHNLGMEVIAEGVETARQLELLREMGCEYGQGYYFSEPRPGHAVGSLLAERSETA